MLQLRYDLLITNGHVIDPSQGIDTLMDVGITRGRIAKVGMNLSRQDSMVNLDVRGKYVCPGLIDLHGHWYEGSAFGIDPHFCLNTGVTTAVDAGSSGFVNFPEFRRNCIDKADVQLLAFVNIGCLGLPTVVVGELEDLRYARPIETASILERNQDVTVGVKIREGSMTGGHGIKALELAITAAAKANVPLMVHISPGADTPEVLRRLRPGDILTHCYQGRGDGIFSQAEGLPIEEAVEARRRGILFDVGHGCASFKWETAQKAFEHSFFPDTISTDLHRYSVDGPACDMPTTLSKFLCLGMSVQDVVLKSTWMPAKSIWRDDQIGTLRPGTTADVCVFEIETGEFEYVDTHFQMKIGHQRWVPRFTVKGGRVITPGTYNIKLRALEHCDHEIRKYVNETT